MSDIEEKINTMSSVASSGKARCFLKKHLTYKSGEAMYIVLDSDSTGPKKISVKRHGKGIEIWNRIQKINGDYLMEIE